MSILEAALRVLRESSGPLHAREIARRILEKDLWETTGKTPQRSVASRLYSDIKLNGDRSPFVLSSPQTFSLRPGVSRLSRQSALEEPIIDDSKGPAKETYSFMNAAGKVLDQSSNQNPMHYREITRKALREGWLQTDGKTPEATMYSQILTEIHRAEQAGVQPRFVQHGKGYVGLSKWMGRGIALEIEKQNRIVRKALHRQLLEMKWEDFEELIAELLTKVGFEVSKMTRRSGDGGIDVRATLVVGGAIRTQMAVQVKKWKRNVQAPIVQQVRGSLGTHEQGLIVTTSNFSSGARTEAARSSAVPVALMNGEQLVALLVKNDIGVSHSTHDLIELRSTEIPTRC